jgi:hypothetical protein
MLQYRIFWLYGAWNKNQEQEVNGERLAGEWGEWTKLGNPSNQDAMMRRWGTGPTRIQFRMV